MKVTYRAGDCEFVVEAQTVKAAFEAVAGLREVFTGEVCGCCKGTHVTPEIRERKGYTFYSLRCMDCRAQLDFGVHKDGAQGLFAKRWDGDKNQALPDNGWYVYQGNGTTSTTTPSRDPADDVPPWADEVQDIKDWLESGPNVKAMNVQLSVRIFKLPKKDLDSVWPSIANYARQHKWVYDGTKRQFKEPA